MSSAANSVSSAKDLVSSLWPTNHGLRGTHCFLWVRAKLLTGGNSALDNWGFSQDPFRVEQRLTPSKGAHGLEPKDTPWNSTVTDSAVNKRGRENKGPPDITPKSFS